MNNMWIYNLPFIGKRILNIVVKYENGEMYSSTLRKYGKMNQNIEVGLYSYGMWGTFNIGGKVKIGRYTSVAQGVRYYGANHPIEAASTSALFYNKSFGFDVRDVPRSELVIGNDVWIGSNAQILASCKSIGNGSVIAAGAIVIKDVPPYTIVGGVPAKIIKKRFADDVIELLEKSKWWELPPEEVMSFYADFYNPKIFANSVICNRN